MKCSMVLEMELLLYWYQDLLHMLALGLVSLAAYLVQDTCSPELASLVY